MSSSSDYYEAYAGKTRQPSTQAKIEEAISLVRAELTRAEEKHGLMFASPHEGHSVIREELDVELWEHVVADTGRSSGAGKEACQVAAMAIKYMINFDPRLWVKPPPKAEDTDQRDARI
jgi:hypothetical protein